ncbi:flagellar hook-basal body complex protein FliE [Luteimonas yindakuii]|uniref:Flagellar hook-basal body complex protein FliE n=1 Tax=Luteimonas yindakuii TaxID=2565782 RepID=A0A4Z1R8H7_9GAMM|nr:flagellar hook-basal body complex protein FliE [Luteimonas yindakuii]QCO67689.2 flagellar hook-basal body complex protein FliE [Luteimonas yindakuii]TKS55276.1 flagellar hook-basal body complex protein FliE [Luteimonas yindakuii]
MSHSVNSILTQIRSYQGQVRQTVGADIPRTDAIPTPGGLQGGNAIGGTTGTAAPSFGATLRNALEGVNGAQQRSGELVRAFELGEPGADLAKVMVAAQQSQVAFRATVEVRNRLVQAYQDVMNMPL